MCQTFTKTAFVVFFGLSCLALSAQSTIRSITGANNNLQNPTWGAAHTPLRQFTAASFADGMSAPTGSNRANPRLISNLIFSQNGLINDPRSLSDYTWVFGQFIDHDLTLVPDGPEPMPIFVPGGDPWFDPANTGQVNIPMQRSAIMPGTGTSVSAPRAFPNEITGFLDGSAVYGSDQHRVDWLRTWQDGKLRVSAGNLLPYNTTTGEYDGPLDPDAPFMDDPIGFSEKHFIAGDVRANENPLLLSLHTLFHRDHNYIADTLKVAHPDWNDEQLFQHARKILGGVIQAIVYEEWLPSMGVQARRYTGYKSNVNPTITNVFSAAAFRMGHTLLNSNILLLDRDGNHLANSPIPLAEAFFNIDIVRDFGSIEPFLKGMGEQVQQDFDGKVVDDVRNFLFGPPGAGGLDLASININRGRERGLADFNRVRQDFGLPPYFSITQITDDPFLIQGLTSLYNDVNNIDPWVGLLIEKHMPGALFGETLQTIMMRTFSDLRDGDRFYYEADGLISRDEKAGIKSTRFKDVLKRNTTIEIMQPNVFEAMPHQMICTTSEPFGTISGIVTDMFGQDLSGASIIVTATEDDQTIFNAPVTEAFDVDSIATCKGYSIAALRDTSDFRNGVTTYDVLLGALHILGTQPFSSPWQTIACDVNGSGNLTVSDLLEMRDLILHGRHNFSGGQSWRFVNRDFTFDGVLDPFGDLAAASQINVPNMGETRDVFFVGIKMGDLNGTAQLNGAAPLDDRNANPVVLTVNGLPKTLKPGKSYSAQLTAAEMGQMLSLQGELVYDGDYVFIEQISSPVFSQQNFANEAGSLRFSWNGKTTATTLFNLVISTSREMDSDGLFTLATNRIIDESVDQSFTVHPLRLTNSTGGQVITAAERGYAFELLNNNGQASVTAQFAVPTAQTVTLRMVDQVGRIISTIEETVGKGDHQIVFDIPDGYNQVWLSLETEAGVMSKPVLGNL